MDLFNISEGFVWQDIVLTTGSVLFLLALIPTILGPTKPAPFTSLLTGTVLLVFAGTYATLGLPFATVTTAATGAAWLVILRQSLRSTRDSESVDPRHPDGGSP